MERLVRHLMESLEGVTGDPQGRIADSPLQTNGEQQALKLWKRTNADYAEGSCLHHLFEEQAARTPDAVAVAFEDRQLTYAELNKKANRLAWRLRALGVGPEIRVCLLLERSAEMIAAMLGALKAGGAYVPLDPAYPEERLSFMIRDSGAVVLL